MLSIQGAKKFSAVLLGLPPFHSARRLLQKSNRESKVLWILVTYDPHVKNFIELKHFWNMFQISWFRSPPKSFYLDMNWLGKYWNCYPGEGRVYHHTGPVNSMYALREALAILSEEGLIACYKRHQACTERWVDYKITYQNIRIPSNYTIRNSINARLSNILRSIWV